MFIAVPNLKFGSPFSQKRSEMGISMDGLYGMGEPAGSNMFWGLPVAFAMDESTRNIINGMSDAQREVLRVKSSQMVNDKDMDELVRMVTKGKFE